MEVTGKIKVIGTTKQVSEKFKSRDLVITTGDTYPQHILLQASQNKCELMDSLTVGSEVTCHINIRGREWNSPAGETKYFNTIEVWKIDVISRAEPIKEEINTDLPF